MTIRSAAAYSVAALLIVGAVILAVWLVGGSLSN